MALYDNHITLLKQLQQSFSCLWQQKNSNEQDMDFSRLVALRKHFSPQNPYSFQWVKVQYIVEEQGVVL